MLKNVCTAIYIFRRSRKVKRAFGTTLVERQIVFSQVFLLENSQMLRFYDLSDFSVRSSTLQQVQLLVGATKASAKARTKILTVMNPSELISINVFRDEVRDVRVSEGKMHSEACIKQ